MLCYALHCIVHLNHSAVVLLTLCDDFTSVSLQTVLISGSCNLMNCLFCFLIERLRWAAQKHCLKWLQSAQSCSVPSYTLFLLFVFLASLLLTNGLNYSIFLSFSFWTWNKKAVLKNRKVWTKDIQEAKHNINNLLYLCHISFIDESSESLNSYGRH